MSSLLILLFFLTSCTSESKYTNFKTASIDKSFEADIRASFDKATGTNDLIKTINSNIEKTIISSIGDPESDLDLNTILQNFNSEFVKFKRDFPDASEPVWELHIETELLYQSEAVMTLAISTYEFKGGAHGNDKITFLNLNTKSGEILNQKDIIKDNDAFKALAKKYFIKSVETNENGLKMEDFFFGKPFQLPDNIGFSEDGLVLLYNIYEVASYDQGYTEFIIPFENATSFLYIN